MLLLYMKCCAFMIFSVAKMELWERIWVTSTCQRNQTPSTRSVKIKLFDMYYVTSCGIRTKHNYPDVTFNLTDVGLFAASDQSSRSTLYLQVSERANRETATGSRSVPASIRASKQRNCDRKQVSTFKYQGNAREAETGSRSVPSSIRVMSEYQSYTGEAEISITVNTDLRSCDRKIRQVSQYLQVPE